MKKFGLLFFASFLILSLHAEIYVVQQNLNVRSGPSASSSILGKISVGEKVDVSTTSGDWGKISYNGADGYVAVKFLATESSNQVSTTTMTKSKSESYVYWLIGIGFLVAFFISKKLRFFLLHSVLKGLIPGGNKLVGKYKCTKCGVTTYGRDNKTCPNGGTHSWFKIANND